MSRIDVLLATFNGGRFLPSLLDSLVSQTRRPDQIVISDDGSSDDTLNILNNWLAPRAPLQVLRGSGGRGPAGNFSYLLKNTDADYILLADQDDIWHFDKIERLHELIEFVQAGDYDCPVLVYSDARVIGSSGEVICDSAARFQRFNLQSGVHFQRLLLQNTVPGCTMMFNRALVRAACPIPAAAVMHDWWLLLVASGLGRVAYSSSCLVDYRQHDVNSVGATRWDWTGILASLREGFATAERRVRSHYEGALSQADCFQNRYKYELVENNAAELDAFLGLRDVKANRRRIAALRGGFRKEGLLRTLAFYYAIGK